MSRRTCDSASRPALPACPSRTALGVAIARCMRRNSRSNGFERRARRSTLRKAGVVLTGRCEAWLVGDPDPLHTALDRLTAYAEAGADCLYAPGVSDPGEIAADRKRRRAETGQRPRLWIQSSAYIIRTRRSRCAPHLCRFGSRAGSLGRFPPGSKRHQSKRYIHSFGR